MRPLSSFYVVEWDKAATLWTVVELFSCAIWSDKKIQGIKVNGKEIKFSQYADDAMSSIYVVA